MGSDSPPDFDYYENGKKYIIVGTLFLGDFLNPGICNIGMGQPVFAAVWGAALNVWIPGFEQCVPGNVQFLIGTQPWNTFIWKDLLGPFDP